MTHKDSSVGINGSGTWGEAIFPGVGHRLESVNLLEQSHRSGKDDKLSLTRTEIPSP
jgi:hypothetical protein